MAQTLDITGPYGNEAGCKGAKDPSSLSEDKLLLNPDRVEGYESYCEFVEVLKAKDGTSVVTALCGGEGETWIRQLIVTPPDPENGNRVQIFHGRGELWGEAVPCG